MFMHQAMVVTNCWAAATSPSSQYSELRLTFGYLTFCGVRVMSGCDMKIGGWNVGIGLGKEEWWVVYWHPILAWYKAVAVGYKRACPVCGPCLGKGWWYQAVQKVSVMGWVLAPYL